MDNLYIMHKLYYMAKYVVTGINKLTGQRERISNPISASTAIEKKRQLMASPARGRPFKYIKIRPFPFEEEWIIFPDGGGKNIQASIVFLNCG